MSCRGLQRPAGLVAVFLLGMVVLLSTACSTSEHTHLAISKSRSVPTKPGVTETLPPTPAGKQPRVSITPASGPPGTVIHGVATNCPPATVIHGVGYSEKDSVWVHDPFSTGVTNANQGGPSPSNAPSAVVPNKRQGDQMTFTYKVKVSDTPGDTVLIDIFCNPNGGTSATFKVS